LLEHKKKLSNLTEFTNNVKVISDYIVENKKENSKKLNVLAMAEQVEKKLNSLNEDERALVKDIMAANSSVAESFFNGLENHDKYIHCDSTTLNELFEFLSEIYKYTDLSGRVLCYDTDNHETYKKCDIYDESGEKITTIKIKRDLVGDSKVDDLINQYKDVDILVIVGDIEKTNDVDTSTGRNDFRSKSGMD
jgi:hypothetical protein